MQLHILAIGKKKSEYDPMITTYQQRIVSPFQLTCEVIEPAGIDHADRSKADEASRILQRIKSTDMVLVLDEHGKDYSTTSFATLLDKQLHAGVKRLVFIIGGSYGLDQSILKHTPHHIRLSTFTLPHELARLILVEQLYRSTNYLGGGKYHHE